MVRSRLDTFGELRSRTGLSTTERIQYRELCAMEKVLLARIHSGGPDRRLTPTLGQGRLSRVVRPVNELSTHLPGPIASRPATAR